MEAIDKYCISDSKPNKRVKNEERVDKDRQRNKRERLNFSSLFKAMGIVNIKVVPAVKIEISELSHLK